MNTESIINYINKRADLYQEVLKETKSIVNKINERSQYPLDVYGDEPYVNIVVEGLDKKVVINPMKVQGVSKIANCTINEAILIILEEELRFEAEQI